MMMLFLIQFLNFTKDEKDQNYSADTSGRMLPAQNSQMKVSIGEPGPSSKTLVRQTSSNITFPLNITDG